MKKSNTLLRVLTSLALLVGLALIVLTEKYIPKAHIVRWISMLIVMGGIVETIVCFVKTSAKNFRQNSVLFSAFLMWLIVILCSAYVVGARPWIMLWMLMIIVGADVGAWFFGLIFGGDKMWEKISANKTWSGQIGGIICGTGMSLVYGLIGTHTFMSNLLWVGISVSLLSQYGDLTASFIKRKLDIKDFSNLLPGHGGIMDRIDGWIYVLPLIWFMLG